MTTQSKKVLYGIKKLTGNTEDNVFIYYDDHCFTLDDDDEKIFDYQEYESEIESIIESLIDEGYLRYTYGNKYNFSLTQKGIHRDQYIRSNVISFLIHNCIGILALIISIIALLTSYGYYVLNPLIALCKQILGL